jgi:hypothetical protein
MLGDLNIKMRFTAKSVDDDNPELSMVARRGYGGIAILWRKVPIRISVFSSFWNLGLSLKKIGSDLDLQSGSFVNPTSVGNWDVFLYYYT